MHHLPKSDRNAAPWEIIRRERDPPMITAGPLDKLWIEHLVCEQSLNSCKRLTEELREFAYFYDAVLRIDHE
jgi:hypothetical protein